MIREGGQAISLTEEEQRAWRRWDWFLDEGHDPETARNLTRNEFPDVTDEEFWSSLSLV